MLMHGLYIQIYVSFVAAIVLFGLIATALWWAGPARSSEEIFGNMAGLIGEILPPAERPPTELQALLTRIGLRVGADLTVYGPDGARLATVGQPLFPLPPGRARSGWVHTAQDGVVAAFHLPDGRLLLARHPRPPAMHVALIALFAIILAAATFPVARRIACRLERLRERVERLGSGDLSARVEVEGNDEVAAVARSFNRAAERIEQLVKAQQTILANASHELRSPLARLRMAVELIAGDDRPELRESIAREIR